MKLISLASLAFIFLSFDSTAFAANSCDCPTLACDPCSVERGISFYSEKCGSAGEKVKSCARPTCIPIDQPTKECPVLPNAQLGPREPVVVSLPKVEEVIESRAPNRVGQVKVLRGSVTITRADGKKVVIDKEADLRENDNLQVSTGSGALLQMEGGNKVHVHPDTEMVVKEFVEPKSENSRKSLIHLLKGKIRNQLEQKYNGKTSYFKVSTKGAVAGVRGTDFVVEYDEVGLKGSRFQTLEGKVMVSSHDGQQTKAVRGGEGLVVNAEQKFLPVYKIPTDQMKTLDEDSRVDLAKRKAEVESSDICKAPAGKLDQCSWRKKSGACVRTRCNANGLWAEETQLPASRSADCPASGDRVADCDY